MAESSLSIGWSDLKAEVGFFIGYGRSSANWSAAMITEIESLVQSGIRLVYYPPAVSEQVNGYEWSWLRPTTTLDIYAAYSTGTVTVVAGVVTLASGTFPSWSASGEFTVSGVTYTVNTRDGDTQITLDDTSVAVAAGTSYSIAQVDYTLPDDFGRLVGMLHYPTDEHRTSISVVSVGRILVLRASDKLSGAPYYVAVRYKASTGAGGQRQEALFYPEPDEDWTLKYEYEAYSGALSDTYPYPLGGMQLAELYIESCLAVAENRINDTPGLHGEQYKRLLVDAITRDGRRGSQNFGQMGHKEDYAREFRRGWMGSIYEITYKGVEI